MIQYHPDAVGSDTPEYRKKAQQINEAYSILHEKRAVKENIPAKAVVWKDRIVEHVFTERNVYMILWEGFKIEYITITNGKYACNLDLGEFDCLLKSLNETALEKLEQIERRNGIYSDEEFKTGKFPYHVRRFHCLAGQLIVVYRLKKNNYKLTRAVVSGLFSKKLGSSLFLHKVLPISLLRFLTILLFLAYLFHIKHLLTD